MLKVVKQTFGYLTQLRFIMDIIYILCYKSCMHTLMQITYICSSYLGKLTVGLCVGLCVCVCVSCMFCMSDCMLY